MGSPIALWSLRYSAFGKPVQIPDPRLKRHYKQLPSEWINFYDADDVIGFPLKTLNQAYGEVVTQDREVNVGSLLTSWNPASHLGYWKDKDVLDPIAKNLIEVWRASTFRLFGVVVGVFAHDQRRALFERGSAMWL